VNYKIDLTWTTSRTFDTKPVRKFLSELQTSTILVKVCMCHNHSREVDGCFILGGMDFEDELSPEVHASLFFKGEIQGWTVSTAIYVAVAVL
jgi:hypothetical protein